METIQGSVTGLLFEADDGAYKVLRMKRDDNGETITAVGEFPALTTGQRLTLSGKWIHHDRYGRQFEVEEAELHEPASVEGIQNYLSSSLIGGVGETLAERITDEFGEDTLKVMDEDIDRLRDVPGIGSSKLETIKEDWNRHRRMRNVMLFLKEHGVSTAYAQKIYERYEGEALSVLKENPYRLCEDVEGIGFKIADQIARKLGMSRDETSRLQAGLEHVLTEASREGHVFLPERTLKEQAQEILDVDVESIETPLRELEQRNRIVRENGENPVVYHKSLHSTEIQVAQTLRSLCLANDDCSPATPDEGKIEHVLDSIQSSEEIDYNEEQMEGIRTALTRRVTILTGGPGTGKTTAVDGIIAAMDHFEWDVKLAAPTGRAAQRLEEATGHSAGTIHRLLDYQPPSTYGKNEQDPLEADAVIVDELSMVDLWLMNRLLQAIEVGTHLVMVGDPDQLPSVGPGDVLNDLIVSDQLPVVRLTSIFRQARESRIIENAHRVNRGEMPELTNKRSSDFFFLEKSEPSEARKTIVSLVSDRLQDHYDLDPFEDVQVVVPMYRGECGVDRLNEHLQQTLNPGEGIEGVGSEQFRRGDRVIQLENDYEKNVFNGDVGRVQTLNTAENELTVRFHGNQTISYDTDSLTQIALAYAITIHKSQGSEFPVIIIPMLTQHYIMLQRNLLYTALTRAKQLAVLVGTRKAIGMAVNNARNRERNTRLPERLRNSANATDGNSNPLKSSSTS